MKRSKSRRGVRRVRVSADGAGVVSHAGVGLLREVAELTGLIENVTEALASIPRRVRAPGVLVGLVSARRVGSGLRGPRSGRRYELRPDPVRAVRQRLNVSFEPASGVRCEQR